MSNEQEKINRWFKKYGWNHQTFFNRPHWTRRQFLRTDGRRRDRHRSWRSTTPRRPTWPPPARPPRTRRRTSSSFCWRARPATPTRSISRWSTASRRASFQPRDTINGMLLSRRACCRSWRQLTGDFAIVRSMQAHALVHSLAQTWAQIGRNPAAALGNIAPNIGSVVAIEKDTERKPGRHLPDVPGAEFQRRGGPGLPPGASTLRSRCTPRTGGIANTTNPDGQTRFDNRLKLLHSLDDSLRINSPNGTPMERLQRLLHRRQAADVQPGGEPGTSAITAADSARYGSTGHGQRLPGGVAGAEGESGHALHPDHQQRWLGHAPQHLRGRTTCRPRPRFSTTALSALLGDLKANGLLDKTLVVMVGEFGRTVGPLTAPAGRDHWPQQFAFFAGGGIKGGTGDRARPMRAGRDTVDYGWSQNRYVYPEDIEATIYSALGIDWTTVRHDDPLGRGFEYVPKTGPFPFLPVHELWG